MSFRDMEDQIDALSAQGKRMFLLRIQEAIALKKGRVNTSTRKQIIAYIEASEQLSIDALKKNLKDKLPEYMLPSQYIELVKIPVLPNGKIDRQQLSKTRSTTAVVPKIKKQGAQTSIKTEAQLLSIWEEVLGFSPIEVNDNFFEIGGDSILSIQIIARARNQGILLPPNALFEHQTISELALFAKTSQPDNGKVVDALTSIWESVLGFSPIHQDDNFFEIGGDSILSIQIVAKARKEGITLKPNALFEHQTIAELSLFAHTEQEEGSHEVLEGIIPLSPITHWFFDEHKNAPHYWNQGVRLDDLPTYTKEQVALVCNYITSQHDALRLRFRYIDSKWLKDLLGAEDVEALIFVDLSKQSPGDYEGIAREQAQDVQANFKLDEGSLFKCIYFSTGTSQNDFCLLIAHHLLVDAISWQIIADDFTAALQQINAHQEITIASKTNSIKEWNEHVRVYAENISSEEFAFWKSQITPTPALPIDKESTSSIEERDVVQLPFVLDTVATQSLLEANKAYSTKTEELLVTALIHTISNWGKQDEVAIGFERHGRETIGSQLDVSKTVGWFTSYFPVKFEYQNSKSIGTTITEVKEKLRSVPQGGIGYGGLRYLKNVFGPIASPEIVFNFLGTKKTAVSGDNFKTTTLTENLRDPRSERQYKLEVNLSIIDDILQGTISFGSTFHYEKTIVSLIDAFKKRIEEISHYCNQEENGGYTPSDFSEADISQDDLDNLFDILD